MPPRVGDQTLDFRISGIVLKCLQAQSDSFGVVFELKFDDRSGTQPLGGFLG